MSNFSEIKQKDLIHKSDVETSSDDEDTKKTKRTKRSVEDKPKVKKIIKKEEKPSKESVLKDSSSKEDSDSDVKPKRKRSTSETVVPPKKKAKGLNTTFLERYDDFKERLLNPTLKFKEPSVTLIKVKDEDCVLINQNSGTINELILVDANLTQSGCKDLKEFFSRVKVLELIGCEIHEEALKIMFHSLKNLERLIISNPIGFNGKIIANYVAHAVCLTEITIINLGVGHISDIFDGLALNRTVKALQVVTGDINITNKVEFLKLQNHNLHIEWVSPSGKKGY